MKYFNLEPDELRRAKNSSPIHTRVDVDSFLESQAIQSELRQPIHEALILRGYFPLDITPQEAKTYSSLAVQIPLTNSLCRDHFDIFNSAVTAMIAAWRQDIDHDPNSLPL